MIDVLRDINNKLLIKYENDFKKFEKQLMISNILRYDKCFFKLSIEDAFNILKDLEISNYKEVYLKLISYNEYIE